MPTDRVKATAEQIVNVKLAVTELGEWRVIGFLANFWPREQRTAGIQSLLAKHRARELALGVFVAHP
jgi:hypothetical protein